MEYGLVKIILAVVAVSVAMFIGLMVGSFVYVDYYEYGFLRHDVTGSVDTSRVLTGGRYAVGPGYSLKAFTATAITVTLRSIAVFASDRLEIQLDASFQYFLRLDTLKELHDTYDIQYHPIMITNAQDALKGAATRFATKDFFQNRTLVENHLFDAVRLRLNGACCIKDCGASCVNGCIPYDECTLQEKGLFVNVKYFQLTRVRIPDDVQGRYLDALIVNLQTEEAEFIQEADVVRKQTDQQIQNITNLANELKANARAEAELIGQTSQAAYASELENARRVGLRILYSSLNITSQSQKSSFDYLRSLSDLPTAHLSVDFDQLIRGNL